MKIKCISILFMILLLSPVAFGESFRFDFDNYNELETYENTHIEFSSLVLNNISLHNSLIAHYPLDTDSNDTQNDYNGTDTNTYYQSDISKFGGAVRLYRNNESVIDFSDYFNDLDNISISLWFHIKNAKKTQCIFSIGDDHHYLAIIIMSENVHNPEKPLRIKLLYVNGYYKKECYIHQKISVGVWYNLALTINEYTGSTLYLNTNKAYCPDITVSPSDLPITSHTMLGYVYNYDCRYIEYYDGWIDNLMIFNITLNDSEIEHLYDVEYINYVYSGFAISQFVNIPLLQQYTDFLKSDNVQTGTGVKYYYRITETDPFTQITHLTNWGWVPTDSKKIQFKIKLNSTGDNTPYINWIEIQYITYVVIHPGMDLNYIDYSGGNLYLNMSISKGNILLNDGIFTLYVDSQDQGTGFNIYYSYADITKIIGLDGQHTIKINWTVEKITGGYYYLENETTINISHIPPDLSINYVDYAPGELYVNASIFRGNNTVGDGVFTLYVDGQDHGPGFNIYNSYADITKIIGLDDGQHTITVNWTIEKITGGFYYLENSTNINVIISEPNFNINSADYYNGYLDINLSLFSGNNTIGNGVFYLYVDGNFKGSGFNISENYAEINITSPLETGIHEVKITWDIPKISGGSYTITRTTIIEAINTMDIPDKDLFEFLKFQQEQIDYFLFLIVILGLLLLILIWNQCRISHILHIQQHYHIKTKMPKEHKKIHHDHHKGEWLS